MTVSQKLNDDQQRLRDIRAAERGSDDNVGEIEQRLADLRSIDVSQLTKDEQSLWAFANMEISDHLMRIEVKKSRRSLSNYEPNPHPLRPNKGDSIASTNQPAELVGLTDPANQLEDLGLIWHHLPAETRQEIMGVAFVTFWGDALANTKRTRSENVAYHGF